MTVRTVACGVLDSRIDPTGEVDLTLAEDGTPGKSNLRVHLCGLPLSVALGASLRPRGSHGC